MSLRDVTMAQMGNGAGSANDVTHRKRAEDLEDFEKVSWVENWRLNEKGRLSGLAEARQICALQAPHEMGGRWKSQNRKNVYLSSYVKEPLNSKVIKSFVPELRSRKCFLCSMYICYEHSMYVLHIRIMGMVQPQKQPKTYVIWKVKAQLTTVQ